MSKYNLYNYVDIVQDIEEDTDKPKKEYVGIIEVRKKGMPNRRHYYIGGIIHASDDSTAYLLSKKYCHKITDVFENMTCEPYRAITTEEAMKVIAIKRTKKQDYDDYNDDCVKSVDVIRIDIDNTRIFVLDTKDFPDLESVEKMSLLEAIAKYPVIIEYL